MSSKDENFKITYIKNQDNEKLNPCLAVFPYNYPNIEMINEPSETKWEIGQNKDKKYKLDKSILGINSRVIYEGRNKPLSNKSEYIIGIINKKHPREINLYDIDSIFCINQKIRRIEENNTLKLEDENKASDKLDLMYNFGTAKAQKIALNMKQNIIEENNIASANITKQILKENAEQNNFYFSNEEMKLKQKSIMEDVLPSFNPIETNIKQVFDFNSIITSNEIKLIEYNDVLQMLKNNNLEKNKKKFCDFVYEYLKGLIPGILNGKNYENKIKYSIYTNELIKFFLLPKTIKENEEKISKVYNIPIGHVKHMLNLYCKISTDKQGKVTYSKNQNLILRNTFHILVLALLLNSYEFNFTSLAKSLKLDIKVIANYYKEFGCTIKSYISGVKKKGSDNNKNKNCVVKMNAPLKFNFGYNHHSKKK